MNEIRQNIATKDWVIIASDRATRPNVYTQSGYHVNITDNPDHDPFCPFCVNNEELDLETQRVPAGSAAWQVRTVHNKYPALEHSPELMRRSDGLYRSISGVGNHEVVIEHPLHNTTPALMTVSEIEMVIEMFYSRGWAIQGDNRIEQIVYFKNHGERAGASLVHPHSQIIALPIVPNNIRQRIDAAQRYFDDNGECAFCVMLRQEMKSQVRLVAVTEHFAAFILYAALSPLHMWIVPRRHCVSFLYTSQEERADLAVILKDILLRVYVGFNDPAYNFVIRSSPSKYLNSNYLHWYVTVIPRVNRSAGFELGSGMFINPTVPQECAAFLRDVQIEDHPNR